MVPSYAEAKHAVERLVEHFARNLELYKRPEYKETQVRVEFIDPLFEALGWDVRNVRGYAEQYKDVVHEDAVKVGGATRAPDYSFRVGGVRKFFLEAKKPSVALKEDVGPAYQLRRYAWSAKLPLSILTDFEEFAVYDCRQRPHPTDKAGLGRVMYLTFEQYPARFDELYGVFGKEAVLQGAFDRYAQQSTPKRGTSEVDAEFLKEIEGWREALARNIAMRNPGLSVHALNFGVQRTIDRIVFLRICEDRGIEEYGRLLALTHAPGIYTRMHELYRQAEDKYNSDLFDFQADGLSRSLLIDDKALKPILAGLYYPQSPYEFSVLPADILGQVYEQFLGKVIRLTPAHRAVVEEKPEVKKAGGVYYTPTYIVDYIVRQTVGRLVGQVANLPHRLRILDPACGSGSFLLGAYQFLLDFYLRWYTEHDPEKHARGKRPVIYRASTPSPAGGEEEWRLTTAERKRILLEHIYGVDVDRQAVEVTKLSLLLKVLEGESAETLGQQLSLWRERALPDLDGNVKCGNSLIGPDYFAGQLLPDEDELRRVNPFDWGREFPQAMADGGFDCVIGNPPYVRSINLKESDPLLWDLYRSRYQAASAREWDIYLIFVEKGLELLNAHGKLGYILPNKFLNSQVGENLRAIISKGQHLDRLIHFGAFQIFPGATTYTCLLFLDGAGKERAYAARYTGPVNQVGVPCPLPEQSPELWTSSEISAAKLTSAPWEFTASGGALLEKLRQWPGLGSVAQVFQGTGTRADKVYLVEERGREGEWVRVYSYEKEAEYLLEPLYLKPALRGRSIGRYEVTGPQLLLIVPYQVVGGKSVLVPQKELAESAPRTLAYLRECKPRLDEREKGRFKGKPGWYAYGYPRSMTKFDLLKIVMPDVCNRGKYWLEDQPHWLIDTAYGIVPVNEKSDPRYLLGILNSPLLTYFLKETGTALRGGYFRMKTAYLNPFPIRPINFSDPADAARHAKMVALVEHMLALHEKLAAATVPADKTLYQRQIEVTDRQIDALVYELYGLTEEEIAIVAGNT